MTVDNRVPKISIIILVYNVERYVEKCMRSLFGQTFEDIEFIIIDDGSSDKSIDIVKNLLDYYPNRKENVKIIIHEKNLGTSVSRRQGILEARGEYVIYCDSDDWVEPNMFETMYSVAKKRDADLVSCGCFIHTSKGVIEKKHISENELNNFKIDNLEGVLYSSLWDKLVKRSLIVDNKILPFENINYWEDLGMTIRMRFFSKKTICIQNIFYNYNKLNDSSLCTTFSFENILEQVNCAREIEKFFIDQNSEKRYSLELNYLKFISKNRLFGYDKNVCNFKLWKSIYPESHDDIWKYKNISFSRKLACFIALKMNSEDFPWIIRALWFLKQRLFKYL